MSTHTPDPRTMFKEYVYAEHARRGGPAPRRKQLTEGEAAELLLTIGRGQVHPKTCDSSSNERKAYRRPIVGDRIKVLWKLEQGSNDTHFFTGTIIQIQKSTKKKKTQYIIKYDVDHTTGNNHLKSSDFPDKWHFINDE